MKTMSPQRTSAGDSASAPQVTTVEHTYSTIALCCCVFTHSYLLISAFPYSGYMAMDLIPSANQENVGSYAGLIASAFMIGRSLTSYGWGKLADVYGRTAVLYASLGFSFVFTLLFGLSKSFSMALLWRLMLGAGNGIMVCEMNEYEASSFEDAFSNVRFSLCGIGNS